MKHSFKDLHPYVERLVFELFSFESLILHVKPLKYYRIIAHYNCRHQPLLLRKNEVELPYKVAYLAE